ncbi:MAG TPA: hypothetical protein VLC48_05465, partial [Gemmatimonadota bacterium]|nr:hypothetical protein [Gemmatimonadota bacterium]
LNITMAQLQSKFDALSHAGAVQETLAEAVSRIRDTRDEIDKVLELVRPAEAGEETAAGGSNGQQGRQQARNGNRELQREARALKQKLTTLEEWLWEPPSRGKDEISADTTIYSRIRDAYRSMSSSRGAPTQAELWYLEQGEARLEQALEELNRIFAEDVAAFRAKVTAAGLVFLEEKEPLGMPEK